MAEDESAVLSWYKADIGPYLGAQGRQLLENYSGLHPDEVEPHAYLIREKAWKIHPYPCIGQWHFLTTVVDQQACYQSLLARLKANAVFIDLGCFFGQELRRLAVDGAPMDNMYATDLDSEFWELGYEMYRDRGKMKATFFTADILNAGTAFKHLDGRVDIILANRFLPLFDWDGQVKAMKVLVGMSKPGSWIVGQQTGSEQGMEVGEKGSRVRWPRFFHNVDTFERIWKQVGEETRSTWVVDASVSDFGDLDQSLSPTGSGLVIMKFVVSRQT